MKTHITDDNITVIAIPSNIKAKSFSVNALVEWEAVLRHVDNSYCKLNAFVTGIKLSLIAYSRSNEKGKRTEYVFSTDHNWKIEFNVKFKDDIFKPGSIEVNFTDKKISVC